MKKELAALGYPQWEPSNKMREEVRTFAFNRVPEEKIAGYFNLDLVELRYHFHRELGYGEQELLGWSARNVFRIAQMVETAPGPALQANLTMLQARSRHWRVPKDPNEGEAAQKPISAMSLDELGARIAEIDRELARTQAADGEAEPGPARQDEPA